MSKKRSKSRSDQIRNSREYRVVRARHLRANPRCIVCGTIRGRVVHHKNSISYFPELAMDPENLVTLCGYKANNCHGLLHTTFKRSYRQKTTKDDWDRFLKLVTFKENLNQ